MAQVPSAPKGTSRGTAPAPLRAARSARAELPTHPGPSPSPSRPGSAEPHGSTLDHFRKKVKLSAGLGAAEGTRAGPLRGSWGETCPGSVLSGQS